MSLRYHILYEFRDGPWGGGNQFLKALKNALAKKNAYTENPEEADIILFNSHHFGHNDQSLEMLCRLKRQNPALPFIHRVDGPIKLVRGYGRITDTIIFRANALLADATIFQTNWSRENSLKLGLKPKEPTTVIMNAPDPAHFYPGQNKKRGPVLRLIASSWAANMRKGFDIYRFLDEHLDFDRFDMTFVGNAPFGFRNITHIPPLASAELGNILREHDIYVTASINDPCSNALCEALACGLPALVCNSGGHPEIVKKGGITFNSKEDILGKIETLATGYDSYKTAIAVPDIKDIADQYLAFAKQCLSEVRPGRVSKHAIAHLNRALKWGHAAERFTGGLIRRLGR